MPLSFRLGTVFFVFFCFGFGIFKMALALLGERIKKVPCIGYMVYFCSVSWMQAFLEYAFEKPVQILCWELLFSSVHALVLGSFLKKWYHHPFIHTLTAAVLGNFIVYTVYHVVETIAWAYTPLFDGKYLLVLTTIYIPYLSGPAAAILASWILRKSSFTVTFRICLLLNPERRSPLSSASPCCVFGLYWTGSIRSQRRMPGIPFSFLP